MAPSLPPEAAERAREIAEAAPVASPAQQARIRALLFGSLPAVPATGSAEAA